MSSWRVVGEKVQPKKTPTEVGDSKRYAPGGGWLVTFILNMASCNCFDFSLINFGYPLFSYSLLYQL